MGVKQVLFWTVFWTVAGTVASCLLFALAKQSLPRLQFCSADNVLRMEAACQIDGKQVRFAVPTAHRDNILIAMGPPTYGERRTKGEAIGTLTMENSEGEVEVFMHYERGMIGMVATSSRGDRRTYVTGNPRKLQAALEAAYRAATDNSIGSP